MRAHIYLQNEDKRVFNAVENIVWDKEVLQLKLGPNGKIEFESAEIVHFDVEREEEELHVW